MRNNIRIDNDIKNILENINKLKYKFNNKKILITGGFGFLGKYLLEIFHILNKNFGINVNVYVVDNFITSNKKIINLYRKKNIHILQHNIKNPFKINQKFDFIVFMAGIASPYYYFKYPFETMDTTILGLKNIFKINHNDNANFIFFSSSEIYGNPDDKNIPTKETYNGNVTSVGSRSCYDESKRIGETICYLESHENKKNVKIIRPFNVFGPGMSINDYRIIPNITRSILKNKKLSIYSNGKQTRTYCYITDAINGFIRVFLDKRRFQIYNIGNDKNEISLINLLKLSEKVINKKIKYSFTSYPKQYPADEPLRRCPNISKAIKNLNYKPQVNIRDGLQKHYTWAIENLQNES